ncbi:SRPBCC domain-containing protein [Streptomyces sp. NPDC089799]|uniref:SRPBCC family protein n=1 Tax=Streptomyces sp. NPDC089799 TaxID=3155066 RepID=UPI003436E999
MVPEAVEPVTLERRIAARPRTVFSFFAEDDKWLAWMGRDGEFAFEPGGSYRIAVTREHVAEGRFTEIDPPGRLVFTWGWAGTEAGSGSDTGSGSETESGTRSGTGVPPGSSTVEVTLQPAAEGTLFRLAHHGLPSPEACSAHAEVWTHYVRRLVTWAEGGDPGPDDWA